MLKYFREPVYIIALAKYRPVDTVYRDRLVEQSRPMNARSTTYVSSPGLGSAWYQEYCGM